MKKIGASLFIGCLVLFFAFPTGLSSSSQNLEIKSPQNTVTECSNDWGPIVHIDSEDNIILATETSSSDFLTKNAYDNSHNGLDDILLRKFTSGGDLLWSTYLGGSNCEEVTDFAVGNSGSIFVVGETESEDFPTEKAFDSNYDGYSEAFVTCFSSNGSLQWSSFIGGGGGEHIVDIVVDSNGDLILDGSTSSYTFDQTMTRLIGGGSQDSFVCKISSEGSLK